MFWYTETDAERKATGRRRMRHMIGMIVASFPNYFAPPVNQQNLGQKTLNTDSSKRLVQMYHL